MKDWLTVAVLALAVGSVAMTITRTSIFRAPRHWVQRKSDFFGDLVSCPYCMSHWLVLAAMVSFRPRLLDTGSWFLDYPGTGFALVALSTFVGGLVLRAYSALPPPSEPDDE